MAEEVFDIEDAIQDTDFGGGLQDLGIDTGLMFDPNDVATADNLDFPHEPFEPSPLDPDIEDGENESTSNGEPDAYDDFIREVLSRKGVSDPNAISIENENGEIEIVSFNDLDKDTQLNILTSEDEQLDEAPELREDEANLLNYLRENELTVEELFERQRASILEELGERVGGIDFESIDPEHLFLLEMQSTYNMTEEEALQQLELEQQNPDLFNKKVEKLRSDYLEAEQIRAQEEQAAIIQQQQEEYEQFGQELFEVAKTVDHIGGLTLSDQEKGEVLDAVLDLDENGATRFSELFKDKNTLFRLAWFALKGEEAFEKLHSHYKGVIEQTRKEAKKATKEPTYKLRVSNNSVKKAAKKQEDDTFSIEDFIK